MTTAHGSGPGALFTDFYELTMMAGYADMDLADVPAIFDLYIRRPPAGVTVMIAAGLELALQFLEDLHFHDDDLRYLRGTALPARFVDRLADLRFSGDVYAVREGTPVFADEPVLRIEAPLAEAQLVETALLNLICYSSLIASTAAEMRDAAGDLRMLEFGARRAHGPDGAVTASRSAFLGGCDATSNVAAGARFGLPVAGTQAHSWVMAFPSELDSFRAYANTFPDRCVLLVDTYDTLGSGVPNAITVATEMRSRGEELAGIRLDSGDLGDLARGARAQLDRAGFTDVEIVASGDLDAAKIARHVAAGDPINSFGVGTALVTAAQDPTVSAVYKLAQIGGRPVAKRSATPAKSTTPGRKQVWRGPDGDIIGLEGADHPGWPLLELVMQNGARQGRSVSLPDLRERTLHDRRTLVERSPDGNARRWPVRRSDELDALRASVLGDTDDGGGDPT